jgi:hypothetical protein
LDRCRAYLQTSGYQAPDNQVGAAGERHRAAQLGFDFLRADRLVRLEVHWALIQKWLSFRLPPEQLWSRFHSVQLGGQMVPVLAPPDNLVYLCAHGAKHQWERLIWICDLAELIRVETNLDWEAVIQRAEESHSLRSLFWGLRLAHELLEAPLPAGILQRARADASVETLVQGTLADFLEHPADLAPDRPRPKSDLVYLRGMDRFKDRCGYLFHLVKLYVQPSEKDRQFVRLPGALSFLYVVLRPVRVMCNALPSAIRNLS